MNILDIETLPLLAFAELPPHEQANFAYIADTRISMYDLWQPRLVRYRGNLYDIHETEVVHDPEGWHSRSPSTHSSGVLFRIGQDDTVTVARYMTKAREAPDFSPGSRALSPERIGAGCMSSISR